MNHIEGERGAFVPCSEEHRAAMTRLTTDGSSTQNRRPQVFRGGILAVPQNQVETARSTGMSPITMFRRIVWPQAIRQALPAYGNEMILMVKATSLASTVTLMEITGVAQTLAAETNMLIEIFSAAALIYLCLTYAMTLAIHLVERRLDATRCRT